MNSELLTRKQYPGSLVSYGTSQSEIFHLSGQLEKGCVKILSQSILRQASVGQQKTRNGNKKNRLGNIILLLIFTKMEKA